MYSNVCKTLDTITYIIEERSSLGIVVSAVGEVADKLRDHCNQSLQFLDELMPIAYTIEGSCQSLLESVEQILNRAIYCIVGGPKEDAMTRVPNQLRDQDIPAVKGREAAG